jgi:WD40 repeat protein
VVLAWADQLLDALIYLHGLPSPVIHRDIKPQNLKLTDGSKIILLDFGLSKSMIEGTIFQGISPPYSPLEQILRYRGGARHDLYAQTDARSDLYALAATLYYLLTRVLPPEADYRDVVIKGGGQDPVEPPHALNPRVPSLFSDQLLRAMSIEPERRPQTARELRDSLHNVAAQLGWPSEWITIPTESDEKTKPLDSDGERDSGGQKFETSQAWMVGQTFTARGVIQCIDFSPKGMVIACGSDNGEVILWNLQTGEIKLLDNDSSAVNALAFSHDGLKLACAKRNTVYLWDIESGLNSPLETLCNDVRAIAFSLDGSLLATGGTRKDPTIIQIWEMRTLQPTQEFKANGHFLTRALCFSPREQAIACALWSGKRLGSKNQRGQVYVIKIETRENQLRANSVRASAIAFSGDGTILACGCRDKTIRLIDTCTGEIERVLPGHDNPISSVVFSPDGHTLATSDADEQARRPGEVRLWDWRTGRLRRRYERLTYGIRAVAFSPQGRYLAYASDRQVKIVRAKD